MAKKADPPAPQGNTSHPLGAVTKSIERLADDWKEVAIRALTPYPLPTVLITKQEVCRRLGILGKDGKASSTIDDWVREGQFTHPLPLSSKQSQWPEAEVQRLVEARTAGMSKRDMKLLVGILEISRLQYPAEYWETPEGRKWLCERVPDAADFLATADDRGGDAAPVATLPAARNARRRKTP